MGPMGQYLVPQVLFELPLPGAHCHSTGYHQNVNGPIPTAPPLP